MTQTPNIHNQFKKSDFYKQHRKGANHVLVQSLDQSRPPFGVYTCFFCEMVTRRAILSCRTRTIWETMFQDTLYYKFYIF